MLRNRLIASHGIVAFVSAGIAAWAVGGQSSVAMIAAAVVTVGTAAGAAFVSTQWLSQAIAFIERLTEVGPSPDNPAPFPEVDALSGRLVERFHRHTNEWDDASDLLVRLAPVSGAGTNTATPAGMQLRQHLSGLAASARNDIQRILSLAEEISRRTHETTSGAEEQSNAVAGTTAAVENMANNVDTVTRHANSATKAGNDACASAVRGKELIHDLVRGMDRIRVHVEAAEKRMLALGERSQEIGSIVEAISEISARTDMLALNASIESVRAGEHGRGFAIVADEVRKLAEQTAGAAHEVTTLIESMQVETQDSIATMADERAQVEAEVTRVHEAGATLENISETIGTSASLVTEISVTTANQLRGAHEIVQAMQHVSDVAQGIRQRADDVRQTTMALSAAARDLDDSVAPLYGCDQGPRTQHAATHHVVPALQEVGQ